MVQRIDKPECFLKIQIQDNTLPFFIECKKIEGYGQFEFRFGKYYIRPLADNNQDEFIYVFENDGKFINKINVFGHFEIGFNNLCALEGEYFLQFDLNGKPVKENELI